MTNFACIPFKLNSNRFPHKNVHPFAGKPLWLHSYEWAISEGLKPLVLVEGRGDFDPCGIEHIRIVDPIGTHMKALVALTKSLDLNSRCVLLQPTSPIREAGLAEQALLKLKDVPVVSVVRKPCLTGTSLFDAGVIYAFTPLQLERFGHIVQPFSSCLELNPHPEYMFDIDTEEEFKAMEAIHRMKFSE